MHRRSIILAGAAASVSGITFARTALAAMGDAEKTYAMRTAMAGGASLMMADIGLEKAHAAKVKEFAKFEHDEQTTIAEVLKSVDPSLGSPKPDAKAADAIAKLKEMKPGAAFDRAFITGQIDGHEQLLTIQEDYLKAGGDRETMNTAKLARGMIKEHLTLLADLKKTAA